MPTMPYRRLGQTGLQVSALSFGAWVTFGNQIGDDTARELMRTAYDGGINFFDNAEGYAEGRAELVMGRILQESGWPRASFVVSSKVFFGDAYKGSNGRGLSRKHVIEACDAALRRLQVDHLDLFFCHRPDPDTPVGETCRAMHDLISLGKVLYWGTSEWSADQITAARAYCEARSLHAPVVEQPQYNLFHRQRVEREFAPLYDSEPGLGTTIWSPLATGLLTGKYNQGVPTDSRLGTKGMEWLRDIVQAEHPKRIALVPALAEIARELGTSLPRLAIAWCLVNPRVSTVILGASRPAQLLENLGALEILPQLDTEILRRLDALCLPAAS
jgi:voltage-dependent potassium channel beta subunit